MSEEQEQVVQKVPAPTVDPEVQEQTEKIQQLEVGTLIAESK